MNLIFPWSENVYSHQNIISCDSFLKTIVDNKLLASYSLGRKGSYSLYMGIVFNKLSISKNTDFFKKLSKFSSTTAPITARLNEGLGFENKKINIYKVLVQPILWNYNKNLKSFHRRKAVLGFGNWFLNRMGPIGSSGLTDFGYTKEGGHSVFNHWLLMVNSPISEPYTLHARMRIGSSIFKLKSRLRKVGSLTDFFYQKQYKELPYLAMHYTQMVITRRTLDYNFALKSTRLRHASPIFTFGTKYAHLSNLSGFNNESRIANIWPKTLTNFTFAPLDYTDPSVITIDDNLIVGSRMRLIGRKHKNFRISVVYWAKKIWQYHKPKVFWQFMRGLSKHLFRGTLVQNIFQNRLDVFLTKHFPVRNVLYARMLIRSGHVYVGDRTVTSPSYSVSRFSLVTVSKKLTLMFTLQHMWLRLGRKQKAKKINRMARVKLRSNALKFARHQFSTTINIHTSKFSGILLWGDYFSQSSAMDYKTKYVVPTNTMSQKMINTAWW